MPNATTRTIWCCPCNREVIASPATGADIYPRRPDLAHKRFWRCPVCRNYVGCHGIGSKPLGNIPGPELRGVRGHIHAILDPIWKRGLMSRGKIYARVSEHIGRPYHTAEIRSIEEARRVYVFVRDLARSFSPNRPASH